MLNHFMDKAKYDFARFGFVSCPLTDEQLIDLYERGVPFEWVHNIGCDVSAGCDFEEAVQLNYSGE